MKNIEINRSADYSPAQFAALAPELRALIVESESILNEVCVGFERVTRKITADLRVRGRAERHAAGSRTSERVEVLPALYERTGDEFKPTKSQFEAYQGAFDWFNRELFAGKLDQCVLNFSRGKKFVGFFAANRWGQRVDVDTSAAAAALHEITLNPEHLRRGPEKGFSTLVHEMCHLQDFMAGTASRTGYHGKSWADMMLAVGLQPTGIPNAAKMTGQKVTHEIVQGGAFLRAFVAMPQAYLLPLSCIAETGLTAKKKAAKNKAKYTCSGCAANIWGKPGLNVSCSDCADEDGLGLPFVMEPLPEDEGDA